MGLTPEERDILENFREAVLEQFGEEATKILEQTIQGVQSQFQMYIEFLKQEYGIEDEDALDMDNTVRKQIVNFVFDTLTFAYNWKYNQPSAN
jgi:RNA binding exosome subunit